MPPSCLDSAIRDGCGLRITFDWRADRYGHELACLVDRQPSRLLISLEGNAQERWPASPPFQQLSIEARADGSQVALLVGMAGKSHWSGSVRVAPDRPRLEFDIACLAREVPRLVGSCYAMEREPSEGDTAQLSFSLADGRAAFLTVGSIAEAPLGQIQTAGSRVVIRGTAAAAALPQTIRWNYAVEIGPALPHTVAVG